jgi:hypothetical protein
MLIHVIFKSIWSYLFLFYCRCFISFCHLIFLVRTSSTMYYIVKKWMFLFYLFAFSLGIYFWILPEICYHFVFSLMALGLDLKASSFVDRHSYPLRHIASPFLWCLFFRYGLVNYLPRAGFEPKYSWSLPPWFFYWTTFVILV